MTTPAIWRLCTQRLLATLTFFAMMSITGAVVLMQHGLLSTSTAGHSNAGSTSKSFDNVSSARFAPSDAGPSGFLW